MSANFLMDFLRHRKEGEVRGFLNNSEDVGGWRLEEQNSPSAVSFWHDQSIREKKRQINKEGLGRPLYLKDRKS